MICIFFVVNIISDHYVFSIALKFQIFLFHNVRFNFFIIFCKCNFRHSSYDLLAQASFICSRPQSAASFIQLLFGFVTDVVCEVSRICLETTLSVCVFIFHVKFQIPVLHEILNSTVTILQLPRSRSNVFTFTS